MISATRRLKLASRAVEGRRYVSSSKTGLPVEKDVPRSSLTTLER
jgi:hypothetical protein